MASPVVFYPIPIFFLLLLTFQIILPWIQDHLPNGIISVPTLLGGNKRTHEKGPCELDNATEFTYYILGFIVLECVKLPIPSF